MLDAGASAGNDSSYDTAPDDLDSVTTPVELSAFFKPNEVISIIAGLRAISLPVRSRFLPDVIDEPDDEAGVYCSNVTGSVIWFSQIASADVCIQCVLAYVVPEAT